MEPFDFGLLVNLHIRITIIPVINHHQFLEYQHQLQQQYVMMMGGSTDEAEGKNNLSPNNSMSSTSQTTSLGLLTQPWPQHNNIAISSSPTQR